MSKSMYRRRGDNSAGVLAESPQEARSLLRASSLNGLEVALLRGSRVDWLPIEHAPTHQGGTDDAVRAYGLD